MSWKKPGTRKEKVALNGKLHNWEAAQGLQAKVDRPWIQQEYLVVSWRKTHWKEENNFEIVNISNNLLFHYFAEDQPLGGRFNFSWGYILGWS